jgi:hypothetical protein
MGTELALTNTLSLLLATRADTDFSPREMLVRAASSPSPVVRALLLLNESTPEAVIIYHAKYDTSDIVKIVASAIISKTPWNELINSDGLSSVDRAELMFIATFDGYHHLTEAEQGSNELPSVSQEQIRSIQDSKKELKSALVELANTLDRQGVGGLAKLTTANGVNRRRK